MALSTSGAASNASFGRITAERIAIVDANGAELITLGQSTEGTGMIIRAGNGREALMMGIDNDGVSSGLVVKDAAGTPRIGMGMDGRVPSLALTDPNGKKR